VGIILGIPKVFKTRWLNHTHWVCDRHIPPTQIPAGTNKCWYFGCPSVRPPEEERPLDPTLPVLQVVKQVPETPRTAREQEWDEKNQALIAAALKEYKVHGPTKLADPEPSKPKRAPRSPRVTKPLEQPSAMEKRRGATQKAKCSVCGATVWRRRTELNRVHFCQTHRRKAKK